MTLLDRYILKTLCAVALAVVGMITVLMLVGMLFEKLPDILERSPSSTVVAGYFLCSLPVRLVQIVPLIGVLSVLLSIGILARTNEILAILTIGVSVIRLARPILIWTGLLVGLTFAANETVIPGLAAQARLYDLQIDGRDVTRLTASRNVLARGRDGRFFLMPLFAAYDNRMVSPTIVDVAPDNSRILRRIEADSAQLVSNSPEKMESIWKVINGRVWTMSREGGVVDYEFRPEESTMVFEEDLHILLSRDKEPEEMNMAELATHVRLLSERQQPVSGLTTDLYLKVAFPLASFFLVLIAVSYGVRMRPGNLTAMMSRGLAWVFGYYGVSAVGRGLAYAGALGPALGAYLPVVMLLGFGVVLLRTSARWHG
jgi:lipopolysaccharide export system permease protein